MYFFLIPLFLIPSLQHARQQPPIGSSAARARGHNSHRTALRAGEHAGTTAMAPPRRRASRPRCRTQGTATQASEQVALPYAGARARAQPLLLQAKPDIAAPASGRAAVAAPPLRHEGVAPLLLQRCADEQTRPHRDRAQAIAVAYEAHAIAAQASSHAPPPSRGKRASQATAPRARTHRLSHLRRCK
ncbi:uncharacterized protein LOC100501362 precursor [Zea mays]|jgi:hypothetical protein|uniref:Uncharacterized protein n=1 Tax=Zea mays TaxID=4577 RepID=C4J2T2_MAIZE|nr:uncharacterized protein LOC100501362 precursor [Zea mays]ACR35482.1 unknown [Zea mays]|eukprot:NP_001183034.1 uncharacterized protein LOC100501362 precursor [Zea mays]